MSDPFAKPKETILEEAQRLIDGDRQSTYGKAIDSFERIAGLWSAYLHPIEPLTAMDVANLMSLLKISRAKSALGTPEVIHRDSYVDLAGYAALAVRCHEEILESQKPEPRVWQRLYDVPDDVYVTSAKGCRWKNGMWSSKHANENGYDYDETAPFTEVV
ncbi:hypothetical protein SEA_SUPERCHUNK_55 [Mycobacterium phage Superchunk]|nr:hypothetical protein SEA_SUPERCHUNK_55 [Mycobacterium phage Superchunk]